MTLSQVRVFFGQSYCITIEDLFNWSVEKGWDMFWDTGKKHYHEEMMFYDLLAQVNNQDESTAGGEVGNGSGESNSVDLTEWIHFAAKITISMILTF